eukprot:gnl/TRDRNA2_/TRDRNA2_73542_c1_seq1.p1 gnl/TRDRNA2_/TRDRNA2_73542_c1~~gnl/TRDRNA2_/TRDRNA2_73542_c1_seq1.p1  ORF type:complete len:171 (+),score=13.86 gnl/TRDRNA2_/TRDRNA2_73542_c1_seq1:40-513(+)
MSPSEDSIVESALRDSLSSATSSRVSAAVPLASLAPQGGTETPPAAAIAKGPRRREKRCLDSDISPLEDFALADSASSAPSRSERAVSGLVPQASPRRRLRKKCQDSEESGLAYSVSRSAAALHAPQVKLEPSEPLYRGRVQITGDDLVIVISDEDS